jgi:hypothetical protein
MNIRPLGAEWFHSDRQTDRRTDMTKLTVTFRNFASASENGKGNIYIQDFKAILCLIFQRRIGDSKEHNVKGHYERHITENVERLRKKQVLMFAFQIKKT